MNVKVLVTRPEPENARTAATLRALGHEALLAPLLRFEPLPGAAWTPGPFAALLVTSANAVRALAGHPRREAVQELRVFAVGDRTAAAARASGFARVVSARGDAGALAALVADQLAGEMRPLLHLAGEDHVGLATDLAPRGIHVETAAVYRMAPAAGFPGAVAEALRRGEIEAVLHYSPRSAEAYLACARAGEIERAGLAPAHACLSAAVAAPLERAGARRIALAAEPNEDALLRLIPYA